MDRDETRKWWVETIADLMDRGWSPVSMAWDNASGNRVRIFPESEDFAVYRCRECGARLDDGRRGECPVCNPPTPIAGGRGPEAVARARRLVGRSIRRDGHEAMIIDVVQTTNGYVRWVVQWDVTTPSWWGTEVSPGAGGVELLPQEPEHLWM